jgi:hypothetical protein
MRRILILMLAGAPACWDEGGQDDGTDPDATDTSTRRDGDADTDSDTDSDTDADTDSDTDVARDDVDEDGVTEADGDCNDADWTIHPGAVEDRNLLDDDCDGLVDEDFVDEGDVLVSEIMIAPVASNDATGEWFELYNASESTIDVVGWVLSADDGDEVTIARSVVIPPGQRIVLGVSDDLAVNGGVFLDYTYDRDRFDLADDTDSIFLSVADRPIFDLTWTSTWPEGEGSSLNLDPYFHDRMGAQLKSSWCVSLAPFGEGDRGTPGTPNDWCPDLDRDGDLLSMAGGDCDDLDATVGPDGLETWDGVDDDCNGLTDDITPEAADASVIGADHDTLGFRNGLGVGDWSHDGLPDLVVGGIGVGGDDSSGLLYAIDATELPLAAGDLVSDFAFASIAGHAEDAHLGSVDAVLGDNNGDDRIDVVVAGASVAEVGGTIGGWFDGGSLTGDLSIDDADVTFEGGRGELHITVESHLDLDADGADEIAFGDWERDHGQIDVFYAPFVAADEAYVLGDDDDFTLTGDALVDQAGAVIAGADLDADGYDDLLIGAPGNDEAAANGGQIYVVPGGARMSDSAELGFAGTRSILGDIEDGFLGEHGVPQIADFDCDGTLDVAVSSNDESAVWVFRDFGAATGDLTLADADVAIVGSGDPKHFGIGLSSGDVDADGFADLLVGASDHETAGASNDPGAAYLFFGPSLDGSLTTAAADLTIAGTANDEFGMLVAAADLDGDEKADVVSVATSHTEGSFRDQGRMSIFLSP